MGDAILTDELRDALLRAIRRGAPSDVAAAVAGVSLRTWQRWKQQGRAGLEPYASLYADVERAEAVQEAGYVSRIRVAGKSDWKADAWLLERGKPQRWAANREAPEEDQPTPANTGDPWDGE